MYGTNGRNNAHRRTYECLLYSPLRRRRIIIRYKSQFVCVFIMVIVRSFKIYVSNITDHTYPD